MRKILFNSIQHSPIEENLKSFPSAGECARPAFSAIRGYGSLMRVALPGSD